MVPEVGISRPANIMRKVLLPQPLGPMTTRNSPWPTVRLTPSRATTSRAVPAPHSLVMSVQMIAPMLASSSCQLSPLLIHTVGQREQAVGHGQRCTLYSCALLFHD